MNVLGDIFKTSFNSPGVKIVSENAACKDLRTVIEEYSFFTL